MSSKNELFNYGRYQAENTGRDDDGRITEAERKTYETEDPDHVKVRRAIELKREIMRVEREFSLEAMDF